jgi:hypothetical protein
MNDDVTVAMPWRPAPDRLAAHQRIRAFWRHARIPVVEADSLPTQPFNLCEARNNAVRKIRTPIVVIADADTLPDLGALLQAITELRPNQVAWPYHTYRHIPADWADKPDLLAAPPDRIYHNSVGGLFLCHRDTYWNLGGMDEHFHGWGYDDNAFYAAALTLGTVRRLPGIVFSFNHAADRDTTDTNPNKHRAELYRFATGKPPVMRQLIKH